MRLFEGRSDHRMDVPAAERAAVGPLGLYSVKLGYSVALGALYLLAEARSEQVIEASIVVGELREELLYCKGFCHGFRASQDV